MGFGSETNDTLSVFGLDIAAKKWTQSADLPFAAQGYDLIASNGRLYAMFGCLPDDTLSTRDRLLNSVYCFDGDKWEKKSDVPLLGRVLSIHSKLTRREAVASVGNGLLFAGVSADGGGNVFLYKACCPKAAALMKARLRTCCTATLTATEL